MQALLLCLDMRLAVGWGEVGEVHMVVANQARSVPQAAGDGSGAVCAGC